MTIAVDLGRKATKQTNHTCVGLNVFVLFDSAEGRRMSVEIIS